MNSRLAEIYAKECHHHFKIFNANWPLNEPTELGDYGYVDHDIFERLGNISSKRIKFESRSGKSDDKIFQSKDGVEVQFAAKGQLGPSSNASVVVKFSNESAVFLYAADCKIDEVENKELLGQQIKSLDDWDKKYVIVTELIRAGATTVIVSGSKGSSVSLEAGTQVPQINFANANVQLSATSTNGLTYREAITEKGLVPLIGLWAVKHSFLNKGEPFVPIKGVKGELGTADKRSHQ